MGRERQTLDVIVSSSFCRVFHSFFYTINGSVTISHKEILFVYCFFTCRPCSIDSHPRFHSHKVDFHSHKVDFHYHKVNLIIIKSTFIHSSASRDVGGTTIDEQDLHFNGFSGGFHHIFHISPIQPSSSGDSEYS